ncbi:nucleotide exchange factor GrpE [Hymenobacter sp. ISL-91]|uniref:nucleotide exchange factor GrpE n=1 Tax=Hymenobacter sp. ISL-91 TaxID=2819151 RepID=UPI001BE5CBFE|nr:nucleotide exchange factor GrpE [Hymenobacter sp. ISL-91]MBT2558555.1 nucleotide exchange factor GrpE [Hymenobacter sp. ISL-91]
MADDQNLPQDDNLTDPAADVAGEMTDETTPETDASASGTELTDLKDKYLRLAAEFENYKRRTSKERIDLFKSANQELMAVLLPVLDDLDRARHHTQTTDDAGTVREAFDIIQNKLGKTLEQKGLTPMNAVGTAFDPELHEAITQIPAPSEDMKGKIVDEVEKGYYLGDKVLRHAKVVLGQ